MKPQTLHLFAAILALSTSTLASADNWPQWRGANLDGISTETGLPVKWSGEENVAWKIELPGSAGATPCVWNDKIFLTSVSGNELLLLCYSIEGKEQWRQIVGIGNKDVRGDEGNSAAPSPCTDGKHVWALFANGAMACYTLDGEVAWKLELQERYGKFNIAFGMTSTPVLDKDRIYLQLIHGEGDAKTREAIVVALDSATGTQIWKHDRQSDAVAECEHSYASPTLYRDKEREFLLSHGADFVIAHNLKDGSEIWRCGDLNPKGNYNRTLRFVSSPLAIPGLIIVPSAKNGPVFCLNPDIAGDITESATAYQWKRPSGTPDVPSPLAKDGLVYLCRENGNFVCVD
ncbi:MAG: outer membrane protein assembly factor BamB, partial [Pirellulaceae bacterium]